MDNFNLPEKVFQAIKRKENIQSILNSIETWKKEGPEAERRYYIGVLYCACVNGHSKLVDYLLAIPRILYGKRGYFYFSYLRLNNQTFVNQLNLLLFLALYNGHRVIATSLVQKGANFECPHPVKLLNSLTNLSYSNKKLSKELHHLSLQFSASSIELILARDDVDTFNYFVTDTVLNNKSKLDSLIYDACVLGAIKCFQAIHERAPTSQLHEILTAKNAPQGRYFTPLRCVAARHAHID